MTPRRPTLIIALVLVVGACSGGPAATTSSTTLGTTTTTTTTLPMTTTTTLPPSTTTTTLDPTLVTIAPEGFRSPVNGRQPELEAHLDRRAVAVKIDNHPDARPQSGLEEADAIVEFLVEGGFTRFMAIFHVADSEYLGPVRSLRPTDSTIAAAIPAAITMSGGQPWVQDVTASRGVPLIGEVSPALFRTSTRAAPHNLYADTAGIRQVSDRRGISDTAPQWLYALGQWHIPTDEANEVVLSWSGASTITWKYTDGIYERFIGTTPHTYRTATGDVGTMSAEVLVILVGRQYTAYSHTDQGSPVPATDTIGSNDAYVISRGGVWRGTWSRSSITDRFVLHNDDGTEAVVPPGVAWVSIFPNTRSITIR